MRAVLRPHPDFPAPAIAIEAEAERSRNALRLGYRITGDLSQLRIPPPGEAERADELWRHTCFEAFVAPLAGAHYIEINVAPSGKWATYRFDGYRQGMSPAAAAVGRWRIASNADELSVRAEVDLGGFPDLAAPTRLALTAVIEAADGALSYWSVAHPPGRPDFHHRDCLALELAAPEAP